MAQWGIYNENKIDTCKIKIDTYIFNRCYKSKIQPCKWEWNVYSIYLTFLGKILWMCNIYMLRFEVWVEAYFIQLLNCVLSPNYWVSNVIAYKIIWKYNQRIWIKYICEKPQVNLYSLFNFHGWKCFRKYWIESLSRAGTLSYFFSFWHKLSANSQYATTEGISNNRTNQQTLISTLL